MTYTAPRPRPHDVLSALLVICATASACARTEAPVGPGSPPNAAARTVPETAPTRDLRVRIVAEDGSPTRREYVRVWWGIGESPEFGTPVEFVPADDGIMVLAGLPAATVTLCALSGGFVVPTTGMPRTLVGVELDEVVLTLDEGTDRTLQVVGWPHGTTGTAYLAAVEDLEPSQHSVDEHGTMHLSGLRPGATYNLYVREDETSRAAVLRDLTFDAPWPEIELAAGHDVSGRMILPDGCERPSVALLVGRAVMIDRNVAEDAAAFLIRGVPAGIYTVVAYATHEGRYLAGSAEITAGGTATIDLRPESER